MQLFIEAIKWGIEYFFSLPEKFTVHCFWPALAVDIFKFMISVMTIIRCPPCKKICADDLPKVVPFR